MKNYYQILEVPPDASQDFIKDQYRFLVQAWHPDKFPSPSQKMKAEEKIKELNAAYEILRNPAKRAEYDRTINAKRASTTPNETVEEAKRRADEERRKEKKQKIFDEEPNSGMSTRSVGDERKQSTELMKKKNELSGLTESLSLF